MNVLYFRALKKLRKIDKASVVMREISYNSCKKQSVQFKSFALFRQILDVHVRLP